MPAAIRPALTRSDWETARALVREYERDVDAPACFEGLERELAELDRRYVVPQGRFLLVVEGGEPVGCAAYRVLEPGLVEGRRLYLRPAARGKGLGRAMVRALVDEARAAGFRALRLETLPGKMSAAAALYRRLGFQEIAPYVASPVAGASYLELALDAG
jgi:putative acetyltransferase